MSQFDIVEKVFESEHPVTKKELISTIDLHSSSIIAGIKDCIKKGYIEKTEQGYINSSNFDQEKLESIRPQTIDDLLDDK